MLGWLRMYEVANTIKGFVIYHFFQVHLFWLRSNKWWRLALNKGKSIDSVVRSVTYCQVQTRAIMAPGGGGVHPVILCGSRCRPVLQILTLFQTNKCYFPHPFSDQTSKIQLCWPNTNYLLDLVKRSVKFPFNSFAISEFISIITKTSKCSL